MRRIPQLLLIFAGTALLAACASRGPGLDRMDADTLFSHGMDQLVERRWSRAQEAFQQFTFRFPNHVRAQEARYRLGEAYQGRREWITAATEFNRLARDYPAGAWADDARFQVCASYYELSPRPQLDQEYTHVAIEHCRSLLAYYPDSEYVPRAEAIIEELTERLAEKEFRTAELYSGRRAYDSAIIYYQIVAEDYPGTSWAPRALLGLHRTYERLGYEPEAAAAREHLLRAYPDSPEARQLAGGGGGAST
jgi:outer membrane protein assembly factor BamD